MEQLLSPADLARIAGVPLSTVYRWNYLGTGPRVIHIGKHCRYRPADVDRWLEAQSDPRRSA